MPHSEQWEASLARLRRLAEAFAPGDGVQEGRIFSGRGLRVERGFFVFVGHDGDVCFKVSEDDVRALVVAGVAEPLIMRGRELREWVRVSADRDDGAWWDLMRRARSFVDSLSP